MHEDKIHPPDASAHGHGRNGSVDHSRDRVSAALSDGAQLAWDTPSRFRGPGIAARRVLRRLMKPVTVRQDVQAQTITQGLREAAGWLQELDERMRMLEGFTSGDGSRDLAARFEGLDGQAASLRTRIQRLEEMRGLSEAVILDGGTIMELQTIAGSLWYHKDDPLIAPAVKEHGMWEPDISSLLPKVLRPGMTFVDVGANVGYFPVMASKLVGASGRVFAVEPEPRNLALLRANLWRNGVRNCSVLPVAAYHQSGHVTMALNEEMRAAWIVPGYDTTFLVPCARLDDVIVSRKVDVMKVDAEGADHLVIRGAENLIAANPDMLIVVEFLPREPIIHGETPAQILDYFLSLGLNLYLMSSYGDLIAATPAEVLARGDEIDVINLALKAG
jgi:FkbM family methyltransferase